MEKELAEVDRTTEKDARRYLSDVPQEKAFLLKDAQSNARVIKNLHELTEAFRDMDTSSFAHHVTGGRNDFASWIRESVQDAELAVRISHEQSKEEMGQTLAERVLFLEELAEGVWWSDVVKHVKTKEFALGVLLGMVLATILANIL
ncbi:hypothetical protein COY95_01705 [Candidatus Woesearchaeota archaeon CG_4_10_14_0_8_um_filter_47_5]|nr:MAG: hypothetical protein COY95_01705 [Candidatus Woesearchaeota archaeon CG_4_10_14_0_8_um_filter_47_5]